MSIPESQLETWSHQGAVQTSAVAYSRVREALLDPSSPLATRGVEIFLQGSYANTTNIYADSDVDIVVLYPYTYFEDTSALSPAAQQMHAAAMAANPASYHWSSLRSDARLALENAFGASSIKQGNKALKVNLGSQRMTADVVPATLYRRHVPASYYGVEEGIAFFDLAWNQIVNFPRQHFENGRQKNAQDRTRGWYKMTVRVFKNMRNAMVERGLLAPGIAPSYFIEGALSNAPDNLFSGYLSEAVPGILTYLAQVPREFLMCQNGIVPLLGSSSTQWPEANFNNFVFAAHGLWESWRA